MGLQSIIERAPDAVRPAIFPDRWQPRQRSSHRQVAPCQRAAVDSPAKVGCKVVLRLLSCRGRMVKAKHADDREHRALDSSYCFWQNAASELRSLRKLTVGRPCASWWI